MTTVHDLLTSRIPPHSLEAERAVLGAILEWGADVMATAQLVPEDFYKSAHGRLMAVLIAMRDDDRAIDPTTVTDACREQGIYDELGGEAMLVGLQAEAGVPAHVADYARTVKEARARRDTIRLATEVISQAFDAQDAVGALLEVAHAGLSSIAERVDLGPEVRGLVSADEPLYVIAQRMCEQLELGLPDFVVPPVQALVKLLNGGWLAGELVYLGAGPGTGKTAIALEWGYSVASTGVPTLVISAEMTKAAIARRVLTQRAEVPAGVFRSGRLEEEHWHRVAHALSAMRDIPMVVDDEAVTLGAIRRLVKKHRPRLVIVDYVQLLHGPKTTGDERRLEIDAISRGLKRIAKRSGAVMLVLSQINLVPDAKGWFQRPLPTALKESRGLQADADTILMLWRPKKDDPTLEMIVSKGRDHATGNVEFHFTPTYLHFREM